MAGTANSGGRNRKSEREHKLAGTFQKVRHAGSVTPEPPKGRPESPRPLAGEALAEWGRMIDRLEATGAISRVDGAALYAYCRLHADAERLQDAIDELGSPFFEKVSVDGAGVEHAEPKVHPGFAQLRSYRQALRQFLVEFGLTPSARTRVKLPEKPAGDEWSDFDDTEH